MTPYAHSETPSPSPSMAALDMGLTPSLGHEPNFSPGNAFSPQSPALETPSMEMDRDDIEQLLEPMSVPVRGLASALGSQGDEPREGFTQAELEGYDARPLTSHDIRADPILASLAAKQSVSSLKTNAIGLQAGIANLSGGLGTPSNGELAKAGTPLASPFKARGVPCSTNLEGLGPRMNKSSVLRLGLDWDAEKAKSGKQVLQKQKMEGQEGSVEEKGTPGHKRVGLGITVPSLAAPSIAPKPTKASLLRATGEKGSGLWPEPLHSKSGETSTPREVREELALANREKERLERLARRKSLGINLASLNEPSVFVRQNKTSQLRAAGEVGGGLWPAPGTLDKATQTKEAEKKEREMAGLVNQEKERLVREERRKTLSVGIAALAEPNIVVKGNKTSKLRETGEKGTELWHEPKFSLATENEERDALKEREMIALANKAKERSAREHRRKTLSITAPIAALSQPTMSVRGNKTSELRATGEHGNGLWPDRAKVVRSADAAKIREEAARVRKEVERLERLERRKSFAPPVSLGKPSISAASLSRTISTSALKVTDADNLEKASKESDEGIEYLDDTAHGKEAVKSKTSVKSLGAPSITPRLNRTAMLRTAGKSSTSTAGSSSTPSLHRKAASMSTPLVSASASATSLPKQRAVTKTPVSSRPITPKRPVSVSGAFGPRPNKTSLLRAQTQAQKDKEKR
ncbi:hypothetical protein I316_04589 [Kwoniella heveanensis BCC8398]|uniref:Uncharacterized protein n=1 Tax=Kwoniella heveanensis BCC8398 TaxID=1296120 RepID=A0A1B9GSB0_9TREE|nr:hypothetical protein I316_04589 [Kwoniella heveanensis BCC8398]